MPFPFLCSKNYFPYVKKSLKFDTKIMETGYLLHISPEKFLKLWKMGNGSR